MSAISLRGVKKIFSTSEQEITAVDDVSLDFEDGEFIVLVGPSGSGKSTTLRLIAGLETITDGEIRLDDEAITNAKPKNRNIAMVFQNYALYPHLTARENIGFGLRMQGELSNEEINDRIEHAAEIMSIEDLLNKMPDELSGGQKQRVALGRAIVRNPAAFLMDEPLSNLDAKLRTQMRTEIQMLQEELGVTTVYVTHDQVEAMTMGDRIAIMNKGAVQQVATPLEAYYKPANQFVAGFIGSPSMNFFEVSVRRSNDEVLLQHEAFTYRVDSRLADAISDESTELVLGVRPEDIEIDVESSENTISIDVDVVEPLGQEQLIYFTLGEQTYTGSVSGGRRIPRNETVEIRFPPENIHLFDNQSGDTIANCIAPEDDSLADLTDPPVSQESYT